VYRGDSQRIVSRPQQVHWLNGVAVRALDHETMNPSQPILASLPYYDLDIENAQLKARVEAEIACELKRTPKPASDPRVPPDFELFKVSEMLALRKKSCCCQRRAAG